MKLPLQITARNVSLSETAEATIRDKAAKLDTFYDRIMSCRVVVDAPHRHQHQGVLYNVRIDITVPGGELIVKREPHEDLYVSIRDAFDAARRQVQGYARKQRGDVKAHEEHHPQGHVIKLYPADNYGFIATPDEREIYFHRNSVKNDEFDRLVTGMEVRFVEEQGAEGPQATAVIPVGS